MFETSSLEVAPHRAPSFQGLPVSLLIHGLIAAAAAFGALQNVSFPLQAPAMSVSYNLAEDPTPPPPPPPPAAAPLQPVTPVTAPATVAPDVFAPTVIPDEVVPVSALPESVSAPPEPGAPVGVEGGVAGGVGNGVVGGVLNGVAGGVVSGETGGVVGGVGVVATDQVIVPRDAPLRMTPLSQTYPIYPEWARVRNIEDQLVVRYVIGKNGRVKDVSIVEGAHRKIFDDAVVAAVRFWRFRPLIQDGEAKEVVHELTIYYKLNPT